MAETKTKAAADVLASYRRWKEQGESLKMQAQGFLVDRFHELIQEAQQVQQDLFEDFGYTVKFPANPKHAKRGRSRPSPKKAAPPKPSAPDLTKPPAASVAKPSASQKAAGGPAALRPPRDERGRKIESLSRQVEKARLRLQDAKANGGPVKIQNAEDKLYELADELRLLESGD